MVIIMKNVIGATSPQVSFTKVHDLDDGKMYYFLYINGKFIGCFNFEEMTKKFQEVMLDV